MRDVINRAVTAPRGEIMKKSIQRLTRIVVPGILAALASTGVLADDNKVENNGQPVTEVDRDVHKNPITGNTTETVTTETKQNTASFSKDAKTKHKKTWNKRGKKVKDELKHESETESTR
jgi:hypothetical protein